MVRLWLPRTSSEGRRLGSSTTSRPESESTASTTVAAVAVPVPVAVVVGGNAVAAPK